MPLPTCETQTSFPEGSPSRQSTPERLGRQDAQADPGISRSSIWLFGPVTDSLLCLGGLLWILVVLNIASEKFHLPRLNDYLLLISVAGAHVFTEPHLAFSFMRGSNNHERIKIYGLLILAAFVFCTTPVLASYLCKIYVIVVIPHYTMQVMSLSSLYLKRAEHAPTDLEKYALMATVHGAGFLYIMKELTHPRLNDNFGGVPLPNWAPLPVWTWSCTEALLTVALVCLAIAVVFRCARDGRVMPLPVFMLVSTMLGLFVAASAFDSPAWLYAAPFLHGCQSVATTLAERRRSTCDDIFHCLENNLTYFLSLACLGLVLVFGIPGVFHQLGAPVLPATACVLIVASFYHFFDDMVLWKARISNPGVFPVDAGTQET